MLKKSGFTLVELMIVVIVIGILVTIAVPSYQRSVERAKCSQALSILQSMRSAALSYYADNETFGATIDDLETQVGGNFYSDGSNPDWTFSYTGSATGFTASAQRDGGPWDGDNITFGDDVTANTSEVWGGSYPKDDPGSW
jgi:prepilin-type N-terminal cleavage/methylation domain-containing protein